MSWMNSPRTSAEDLGTLAEKNSSTGYEPNDHFITEAYVEYTQEPFREQRFPEDFDYDDVTIGKTLLDACRRRADHSEEEGLSSCLSSSSISHDRTEKPVVSRDKCHERYKEIQRQNSENEQIRTRMFMSSTLQASIFMGWERITQKIYAPSKIQGTISQ